jgi:hypothetical protein
MTFSPRSNKSVGEHSMPCPADSVDKQAMARMVSWELTRLRLLGRLHVTPHRHMDNNNAKPDIERIKREVLENLRELAHTPSESPCR